MRWALCKHAYIICNYDSKVFSDEKLVFFLIFAENIDSGHTLSEAALTSTHKQFLKQNKKIMYTPNFTPILPKVGCKRVYISRTCKHKVSTRITSAISNAFKFRIYK